MDLESISIKKLPPSRWKEFRALRLEALKSEPTAFGSSYAEEKNLTEKEWKRRIKTALFALANGKPIGIIEYEFHKKIKVQHIATLHSVYLNNAYRSKGIGIKLLKGTISVIKKNRKILRVDLSVNAKRLPAIKLYERNGFKVVGCERKVLKVDGKFYDFLLMEKFF